jgi:amino acid transporter
MHLTGIIKIAFNAILSSSVVFQLLAIWIPVVLLAYRRRSQKYLPPGRKFALPNHLGRLLTIVVILVIPLLVVMFVLPPFLPLTASNMSESRLPIQVFFLFKSLPSPHFWIDPSEPQGGCLLRYGLYVPMLSRSLSRLFVGCCTCRRCHRTGQLVRPRPQTLQRTTH